MFCFCHLKKRRIIIIVFCYIIVWLCAFICLHSLLSLLYYKIYCLPLALRFTIVVEAREHRVPDAIAESARPIIPAGERLAAFEFVTCVRGHT